mmetsp:Transcript_23920/g.45915  ORF Transcript_23920/g.45915 Transcript_23920/m.45915 type:complete len:221 (+) Transcript_23920:64-726(+)
MPENTTDHEQPAQSGKPLHVSTHLPRRHRYCPLGQLGRALQASLEMAGCCNNPESVFPSGHVDSCEDSVRQSSSSGRSAPAPGHALKLTEAVLAPLKPRRAPLGTLIAHKEGIGDLEWRPNSEACEICSTKFTWFNRRHHCRACGCCVCKTCSPFRSHLDHPLDRRHSCSSSETFIGDSFLETHVPSAVTMRGHRVCSVCHLGSKLKGQLTLASFAAPEM